MPANVHPHGGTSPPGDELTELAGVAESQTESVQAWALDNGSDAPAAQRLTPGRITAAAVVASVVVTGVATVIALQHLRGDESALTAPTPTATVVAPPPSPTRPAPPLLDGTYRIFHDWAKTTFRNNERSVGGTAHWESEGEPSEVWFAYSATCTETECIAAGTELQHDHRTAVPDSMPMVLRLENGMWRDLTPRRLPRLCYYTDDGTLAGESWHMQETALEPRPDGTFHGTLTTTVETDECDDKGNTAVTPLVATRVSDVPPGITRPPA